MNEIPVLLSAEGLSTDFSRPEKGRKVPMSKMDVERALEHLRSFAQLSSIQLADSDAKITVARGSLRLVVTNSGGRLKVFQSNAPNEAPVEKTPEEVVGWLMSVADKNSAGRQTKSTAEVKSGGLAGILAAEGKKVALCVVLLIGTAVMAWINFGPSGPPEGIQFIDHPVVVEGLNKEFGGSYGDLGNPSQVAFIVQDEALRVHLITPTGMQTDPLRVMSYRYGSLNTDQVLVAENGAVLERDPSGNLVHVGTIYPRMEE
jgi:hypothetical protein